MHPERGLHGCEFAIQLAGGIFVPLEKNASADRTLEIIKDTEAVLYMGKSPAEAAPPLWDSQP